MERVDNPARSGSRFIVAALIIFLIGIWLLLPMLTVPLNELDLIRNGKTVEGAATDSGFVSVDDSENRHYEGWWVEYNFKLDGYAPHFTSRSYYADNLPYHLEKQNLPQPVRVEYLLSEPSINRLSGTGNQTIVSWAKSILPVAFVISGWFIGVIFLFVTGWRLLYNFEGNPLRPFVSVTFRVLIYIFLIGLGFLILVGFVSLFQWLGFGQNSFLLGLLVTFIVCSALPVSVMILRDERDRKGMAQKRRSPC
jgi:hypothetical protein